MRGVNHNHLNNKLIYIFAILLPVLAHAEDAAISRLFTQEGVDGTIVIESLKSGQTFIHNDIRAAQRFSPASTFKVMNTLIAVEEGVVEGGSDVFKWDGHVYSLPSWNRDQTLASAFKVSCVWCYQEIARQIGAEKYVFYLQQSDYGELQGEFNTTLFWLDGSLQITALEQVNFLGKVARRQSPFSDGAYETLQEIMLAKKTPAYSLWAKTGWATGVNPPVGWYVGYLQTSQDVWLFALNMELDDESDLPLRQKLALDALRSKGIID